MEIAFDLLNKVPIFVSPDASAMWNRVFGATYNPKREKWLFPAFPPFKERVLHDLNKVHKAVCFSDDAQSWINANMSLEASEELVASLTLPVNNYEHQDHGLARVLYNHRYILQWGMGTGKTKVILDAVRILRCKTVVLCPLVAAENWISEGAKLTPDLKIRAMTGSRKKKLTFLQEADGADILVIPYDTAKLYGLPTLSAGATKAFNARLIHPTPTLKKAIARVNNPDTQLRLALEAANGRKTRDINLETLELTKDAPQWLTDIEYEMIVADESHRIKRIQSARTKACLKLATRAARRYLLSGTLDLGDPRNLYPQFKFLAKYLMPDDWRTFCGKYVEMAPWNKHIVKGFKNVHVLNKKLSEVSDKRTLDDCVDMPERIFKDIFFDLSPGQQRVYNDLVLGGFIERPDQEPYEVPNGAVKVNKLLQVSSGFVYVPKDTTVCDTCVHVQKCVEDSIVPGSSRCVVDVDIERETLRFADNPKLKILADLLEDIQSDQVPKVIVWAEYHEEMDAIERLLIKQKIGYVRVDGKTSKHIVKFGRRFQEDPECTVYLGQIKTGISVTLTEAAHMIYYARNWYLDDWLQSLDRNYRLGQTKRMVVYRLCARGTVEEQQIKALDMRQDISATLTKRVDCLTCSQYETCVEKEISPWTNDCILDRKMKRHITKVKPIKPKEENLI